MKVDGGFYHEAAKGLTNYYNADCSGWAPVYDRVDDQYYGDIHYCDFCNQHAVNPKKAIEKALAPALEISKMLDGMEDSGNSIFATAPHILCQ